MACLAGPGTFMSESKFMLESKKSYIVLFATLMILAVLARLPQLVGGNLLPDGDESIVGLMAKHIYDGRATSIYFYGQKYGLAIFESVTAAIFFTFFGISGLTLKVAMLFMWLTGLFFLILAVLRFKGPSASLVTGFILIIIPSWAAWSMKARGGYMTAFVFSNLTIWLISILWSTPKKIYKSLWITWLNYRIVFGVGILLGIVMLSQPIWLIATFPFLLLLLTRKNCYWDYIAILVGILLVIVVLFLPGMGERSAYWSPAVFKDPQLLKSLALLKTRLITALSGSFFLRQAVKISSYTSWLALLSFFTLILIVPFAIYRFIKERKFSAFTASCLGIILVIVTTLFMNNNNFGFRYLLPVSGLLSMAIGLMPTQKMCSLSSLSYSRLNFSHGHLSWGLLLILLFTLATFSYFSFFSFHRLTYDGRAKSLEQTETEMLNQLLNRLKANNIKFVYCTHPMFQWNINFLSKESIIARWVHPSDRVSVYPQLVDQAFRDGEPVAVVGLSNQRKQVEKLYLWLHSHPGDSINVEYIGPRYFIYYRPSKQLLSKLGFRVN